MPVKLKPVVRTSNPEVKQGCVYKIIAGYQAGWVFTVCHDGTIQYLSVTSNSAGYDLREVLSKPGIVFTEVTLQEV
ncbi:MAG: hypothetical protein [Caudoviricetes sp.]|nr:MAG: hypothetical protein [Caudoviricetes sp.]